MSFPPLQLDSIMPFGKYKGEQIEDLIYDQPNYLAWCVNEDVASFDALAIKKMEERKII